jgi:hypothetical protein
MANEWQMVMDIFRGGFSRGFDSNAQYEFRRHDGESFTMRLADQADWYNIAGLWFRPTPPEQPSPPQSYRQTKP